MSLSHSGGQDGDEVHFIAFLGAVVVYVLCYATKCAEYHIPQHLPTVFQDAGSKRCCHGVIHAVYFAEFASQTCHRGAVSRNSKDEIGVFHPLLELSDGIASERVAQRLNLSPFGLRYLADGKTISAPFRSGRRGWDQARRQRRRIRAVRGRWSTGRSVVRRRSSRSRCGQSQRRAGRRWR